MIKIGGDESVTRNFVRYTFRDAISSRFKASFSCTADTALVATSLYSTAWVNQSLIIVTQTGHGNPDKYPNQRNKSRENKSRDTHQISPSRML